MGTIQYVLFFFYRKSGQLREFKNELVYNLNNIGEIERLAPLGLRESLASSLFTTRDYELNNILETAKRKFLDPNLDIRREALEKLWDSWGRLKTLGDGVDKKATITALLDQVAGNSLLILRAELEKETKALTEIGNKFQIRHSEKTQEKLQTALFIWIKSFLYFSNLNSRN
jgi:hypothetical protein